MKSSVNKTFFCIALFSIIVGSKYEINAQDFNQFDQDVEGILNDIVKLERNDFLTSGLIIGYSDTDIYILTSQMAIGEQDDLPVHFYRKPTYKIQAEVIYRDEKLDFALLKMDNHKKIDFLRPISVIDPAPYEMSSIFIVSFKGYKEWGIEPSSVDYDEKGSYFFNISMRKTLDQPGLFVFNRDFQLLGMTTRNSRTIKIEALLNNVQSRQIPLNNLKLINERYAYLFAKNPIYNSKEILMLEVRGKIEKLIGSPKIYIEITTDLGSPFRQAVRIRNGSFTSDKVFLGLSNIYEIENISLIVESFRIGEKECVGFSNVGLKFMLHPDEVYKIDQLKESFSLTPDPSIDNVNCNASTNRMSIMAHSKKRGYK